MRLAWASKEGDSFNDNNEKYTIHIYTLGSGEERFETWFEYNNWNLYDHLMFRDKFDSFDALELAVIDRLKKQVTNYSDSIDKLIKKRELAQQLLSSESWPMSLFCDKATDPPK